MVVSKYILALSFLAVGFLIFVIAAEHARITGQTPALYVVIAYAIFPIAELCIVPIGLSVVTRLASCGMESMMVGIWMLSSAFSNYFAGRIARLGEINFNISQLSGLQKASAVYTHAFLLMAIALLVTTGLLFLVKPIVLRLMNVNRRLSCKNFIHDLYS